MSSRNRQSTPVNRSFTNGPIWAMPAEPVTQPISMLPMIRNTEPLRNASRATWASEDATSAPLPVEKRR